MHFFMVAGAQFGVNEAFVCNWQHTKTFLFYFTYRDWQLGNYNLNVNMGLIDIFLDNNQLKFSFGLTIKQMLWIFLLSFVLNEIFGFRNAKFSIRIYFCFLVFNSNIFTFNQNSTDYFSHIQTVNKTQCTS